MTTHMQRAFHSFAWFGADNVNSEASQWEVLLLDVICFLIFLFFWGKIQVLYH